MHRIKIRRVPWMGEQWWQVAYSGRVFGIYSTWQRALDNAHLWAKILTQCDAW